MNPLISVVIPVYNAEPYLEKCLDSILAQDYSPLEIVIVNDGSTDKSAEICKKYRDSHHGILYVEQENKGVSRARNRGLQEISGEYVTFIDSDDSIGAGYFQVLYDNMVREYADLSLVSISDSLGQKMCIKNSVVDFEQNMTDAFWDLNTSFLLYGPCATLYRSDIIKAHKIEFPVSLSYGEDLVFNCRYLGAVNRIVCDQRVLYHYCRDNQQSLSQKIRPDRLFNELILCTELRNLFVKKHVYSHRYESYLQQRIFDEGYNAIFDVIRSQSQPTQRKERLAQILKNREFINSIKWIPRGKYSPIIVKLIQIGCPSLLIQYYRFRT